MRFLCREPEGEVWRTVKPVTKDPVEILYIYDHLKQVVNLFTGRQGVDFDVIAQLMSPICSLWQVDDVGVIAAERGLPGSAHVHITFWDRRLRGRESLCRGFAAQLMREWRLDYIFTAIPKRSRVVTAFAQRVGFQPYVEVGDRVIWHLGAKDLHGVKPDGEV